MKTLTVCQGWASLIFHPTYPKNIENRTWSTSHRGDLLIHAGKSKKQIAESQEFCDRIGISFPDELVYGAILGIVELVQCNRTSQSIWAQEDNYHWKFANPRLFAEPIACNGALSLWTPSDEILRKVGAAGLVTLHRSARGPGDRLLQPQEVLERGDSRIVTQLSLL
jgi:ASCH domain